MRVEDLPAYLRPEWHAIREQRLNASYCPSPVREVRLPKPGGGTRMLGIPTVLDRFMGPGHRAGPEPFVRTQAVPTTAMESVRDVVLHAVGPACDYISRGHRWVVDLD